VGAWTNSFKGELARAFSEKWLGVDLFSCGVALEKRSKRRPAPPAAPARQYLTPEEGAEFLGIHIQTIRGYIRSGKLPAVRVAGERAIRIRKASLEALLEPLEAPVN